MQHHAEPHAARWLSHGYLNRVPPWFETEERTAAFGDRPGSDGALFAIDHQSKLGIWLEGQQVSNGV
jgi:hypothetical protein